MMYRTNADPLCRFHNEIYQCWCCQASWPPERVETCPRRSWWARFKTRMKRMWVTRNYVNPKYWRVCF